MFPVFCSVLFCSFFLFYTLLFCSILFYSILILFPLPIPFRSIPFSSTLLCSSLLYSILSISLSLSHWLSVYLSIFLSSYLCIHRSFFFLPFSQERSIYPSIGLSIYQSICLSVYLFMCKFLEPVGIWTGISGLCVLLSLQMWLVSVWDLFSKYDIIVFLGGTVAWILARYMQLGGFTKIFMMVENLPQLFSPFNAI